MKKSILLLSCLFTTILMVAQNTSNLTINTTGTSNLKISFNGNKYSLQDRSVTFQVLAPGNYPLTIFQLQNKAGGGNEYVTVFDRTITLTAQKHLEITVMRFGKTNWDEGYIEKDQWNEYYQNPSPVNDAANNNGGSYGQVANSTQFTAIKNAISNEYSDANKLSMARVVLKNNLLTAAQLKEVGELFYSDSNKLEFAKLGYDFCYDKGSYFVIAEILYSSAYKKQLLDYIGSR